MSEFPRLEDQLTEILDELILHQHFPAAKRTLEFAKLTFSRYNEYLKKIQDAEKGMIHLP